VKSHSAKKLLLVALLIVAGYVWWGDLKLLFPSKRLAEPTAVASITDTAHVVKALALSFMAPRVNPFHRWVRTAGNSAMKPAAAQPVPELLHTSHALVGLVNRGKTSQAIVLAPESKRKVLAAGDSLNNWKLVEIKDNHATFRQGKRSDTLWLGKKPK
jgi:hypothetical protein